MVQAGRSGEGFCHCQSLISRGRVCIAKSFIRRSKHKNKTQLKRSSRIVFPSTDFEMFGKKAALRIPTFQSPHAAAVAPAVPQNRKDERKARLKGPAGYLIIHAPLTLRSRSCSSA